MSDQPPLGVIPYAKFVDMARRIAPGRIRQPLKLRRPSKPPAPPPLTPSQATFLDCLTAAQRDRLEQNPRLRKELLEWFRDGNADTILEAEALSRLGEKSTHAR